MTTKILLQGGTILTHTEDDHVVPLKADLLIEGDKIARIAEKIDFDESMFAIDCSQKILSPGFVDTHHHLWQTQLKGRHGDESLLDYIYSGSMMSSVYTPDDIFWGQLGGAMESIDSGTTTVVDFAHMLYSPDHAENGISALSISGIRGFFCYTPTPVVKSISPKLEMDSDLLPPWLWDQLKDLSGQQPFGGGRISLGFAFDAYFAPKEVVLKLFDLVRRSGIHLITSHYVKGPILGGDSLIDLLDSYGLLGPDLLIAHATESSPQDAVRLDKAGAHVSSTPETELQMALGEPVCFRPDLEKISSLGVDCHSTNSAGIFTQMRLALQSARGIRNQRLLDVGNFPSTITPSVEAAFNLGTIQGARALRLEDKIGSLRVGKSADIVIFDAATPSMLCAAQQDPLSAIVLHASTRDIDTVIIDGQIRKAGGTILPVLNDREKVHSERKVLSWSDIAKEIIRSRAAIEERIGRLDLSQTREQVIDAFQIDRTKLR